MSLEILKSMIALCGGLVSTVLEYFWRELEVVLLAESKLLKFLLLCFLREGKDNDLDSPWGGGSDYVSRGVTLCFI